MHIPHPTASIILAAGRGSRMQGYDGSKTLLPLAPDGSIYQGRKPILEHIFDNLPEGPKALVVNHCKEAVIAATRHLEPSYWEQPVLNGTGGALLAAAPFVRSQDCSSVIITMGDVPFIKPETYGQMVGLLDAFDMVVLGFQPADKKQYGLLEVRDERVVRIVEWKHWREYDFDRQAAMTLCNSGIYAFQREVLERYFPVMANRPQIVHKMVGGRMTAIEEYFLTDLVEFMNLDRRPVGYLFTDDENETMGVDDREALEKAQTIYARNVLCLEPPRTHSLARP